MLKSPKSKQIRDFHQSIVINGMNFPSTQKLRRSCVVSILDRLENFSSWLWSSVTLLKITILHPKTA